MKKIIVSIIVIGLLLTTVPLSTVGENEEQIYADKLIELEPEYVPGELIVKFKDGVHVSMSMSTNEAPVYGVTSAGSSQGPMSTGYESLAIQTKTVGTGVTSSTSQQSVVVTGIESLDELNAEYGVYSGEKLIEGESVPSLLNTYVLKLPIDSDIHSIVKEYAANENVEFAEPNYVAFPFMDAGKPHQTNILLNSLDFPNDPYYNLQWGLHNTGEGGGTPDADVDAPEAWDITKGSSDVTIAILDTGVDYTHSDLGDCNQGIIEEDFFFESPHPVDTGYSVTFDFKGCDKVALYFSKINTFSTVPDSEPACTMKVYDASKFPKQLLGTISSFSDVNDIWFPYTELGGTTIKIKIAPGIIQKNQCWGFVIDKVKKVVNWVKPSERFPDKYVDSYDFACNDPDPSDTIGHGTFCAGVAAAVTNNSIGIAGMTPNCKIMPIRIAGWSTRLVIQVVNIIKGIVFAADHGADVISMSFGWPAIPSIIGKLAVDYAYEKGCVLVAAVGNYDNSMKNYPAAYKNVIAVAATDYNDHRASFSTYGNWVDLAAPGDHIWSTLPTYANINTRETNYCYESGTSAACPLVAGIAALILSKAKEEGIELTPDDVKEILFSSTDPINSDKYIGKGRVNAFNALKMVKNYNQNIQQSTQPSVLYWFLQLLQQVIQNLR